MSSFDVDAMAKFTELNLVEVRVVRPNRLLQILSLAFGLGSWIAITGLWIELPLLTQKLPESWALGSYLTVFIQAANIGPLVYFCFRQSRYCTEIIATHAQLLIGVLACFVLIFYWDSTVHLLGEQRSITLFISAFALSLVDCTSSVTFLPFMARFDNSYLMPYLIGEGLSGCLSMIFALVQGVEEPNDACLIVESAANSTNSPGQTARFGPEVFFISLLITLALSWIAFVLLMILPTAKKEALRHREALKRQMNAAERQEMIVHEVNIEYNRTSMTSKQGQIYQGIMIWSCFLTFGFMPAYQSYSTAPYGSHIFHYTVILAGFSYPAGCFIAMMFKCPSDKILYGLTAFGSLLTAYILLCATLSPSPPLVNNLIEFPLGGCVILFVWITYTLILSYVKTDITGKLNYSGGNEALFWVGVFTQVGSVVGAGVSFLLINILKLFKETKCD